MTGRKLLRRYLEETNQCAADVVRRHHIDAAMLSRWLSGERRPSLASALKLEKATRGAVPADSWVRR